MTSWQQIADNFKTDATLEGLSKEQTGAVIDILALTLYADGHAGFMQEMELDRLLLELPWINDKSDRVSTARAIAEASAPGVAGDSDAFKTSVQRAGGLLTDEAVRSRVFVMAAGLCAMDGDVDANEGQALTWLGEAFGFDQGKIDGLIRTAEAM